jgi:hypothetical protein
MSGLKQDIKHDILLKHHEHIMEAMQCSHHIQAKNSATHKYTTGTYTINIDQFWAHRETLPQPTRVSQKEMEERKRKKDYALVVIENGQSDINFKKQKLFTLENNDEEEMEAFVKWTRKKF